MELHVGCRRRHVVGIGRDEESAERANEHDEIDAVVELIADIGDLQAERLQVLVDKRQQELLDRLQLVRGRRVEQLVKCVTRHRLGLLGSYVERAVNEATIKTQKNNFIEKSTLSDCNVCFCHTKLGLDDRLAGLSDELTGEVALRLPVGRLVTGDLMARRLVGDAPVLVPQPMRDYDLDVGRQLVRALELVRQVHQETRHRHKVLLEDA